MEIKIITKVQWNNSFFHSYLLFTYLLVMRVSVSWSHDHGCTLNIWFNTR
jgi:hypothetical protein